MNASARRDSNAKMAASKKRMLCFLCRSSKTTKGPFSALFEVRGLASLVISRREAKERDGDHPCVCHSMRLTSFGRPIQQLPGSVAGDRERRLETGAHLSHPSRR